MSVGSTRFGNKWPPSTSPHSGHFCVHVTCSTFYKPPGSPTGGLRFGKAYALSQGRRSLQSGTGAWHAPPAGTQAGRLSFWINSRPGAGFGKRRSLTSRQGARWHSQQTWAWRAACLSLPPRLPRASLAPAWFAITANGPEGQPTGQAAHLLAACHMMQCSPTARNNTMQLCSLT